MPIRGHIFTNVAYIAEVIRSFPPKKISDQENTPTMQMTRQCKWPAHPTEGLLRTRIQLVLFIHSCPGLYPFCGVCVSLCLSLRISLSLPT